MKVFSVGSLVYIAYMIWARHYIICEVRQHCNEINNPAADTGQMLLNKPPRQENLVLYYGDSLLLGGYESFEVNEPNLTFRLTQNNKVLIKKLNEILEAMPKTQLTVTGKYKMSENSSSFYETKGLERASKAREQLIDLGIAPLRINIADEMTNLPPNEIKFQVTNADAPSIMGVFNDMSFYEYNFLDKTATFRPKPAFIQYADLVVKYFSQNADNELDIIINIPKNYNTSATNALAQERADAIKAYFVALGLHTKQIKTNMKINKEVAIANASPADLVKNQKIDIRIVTK